MKYQTKCGKTYSSRAEAKTSRLYIARKVITGIAPENWEVQMNNGCINCKKARKVKKIEHYLNQETHNWFMAEDTYCVTNRIEAQEA